MKVLNKKHFTQWHYKRGEYRMRKASMGKNWKNNENPILTKLLKNTKYLETFNSFPLRPTIYFQ